MGESDKDRMINILNKDLETLRQEMKLMRERAAMNGAASSDSARELAKLHDELRRERQHGAELERELNHMRETGAVHTSIKVSELQSELSLAKQDLRARDQDLRRLEQSAKVAQEQLAAELERHRASQDQHTRAMAALQRERDDLELRLKQLSQESAAFHLQTSRKDEMIEMLEEEAKRKDKRLEQAERQLAALEGKLSAKDASCAVTAQDADSKARRVAELEAQLQSADAARREGEQREERLKRVYNEMCDLVCASDLQKISLTGAAKLRETLAELTRLQQEVAQLKSKSELHQYELSSRNSKIEQLERDAASLEDVLRTRSGELQLARDQLLQREKDIRNFNQLHANNDREERHREERFLRVQERLDQAERLLAEKDRQVADLSRHESMATADARNELSRVQAEHAREVSRLEARLAEHDRGGHSSRDYVDVCRTIGRLLCVDPDTTSTVYANNILRAVENAVKEIEQFRSRMSGEQVNLSIVPNPHVAGVVSGSAGIGGVGVGGMGVGVGMGVGGALLNTKDEAFLRAEIRENEERWVKLKVQYDHFRHAVAKALHVDRVLENDEASILHELQRLVASKGGDYFHHHHNNNNNNNNGLQQQQHHANPHPPRQPNTGLTRNSLLLSKGQLHSPGGAAAAAAAAAAIAGNGIHHAPTTANYQKLQRSLQTALQTIESQDVWIEVLNKKLEQLGASVAGGNSNNSGLGLSLSRDVGIGGIAGVGHGIGAGSIGGYGEVAALREQVAVLKQQLAEVSLLGGAGGATAASLNGSLLLEKNRVAETAGLQATISELESRLQRHIEFREKLIRVLGLGAASAPDHEIFQKIETLMAEHRRADALRFSTDALHFRSRSPY